MLLKISEDQRKFFDIVSNYTLLIFPTSSIFHHLTFYQCNMSIKMFRFTQKGIKKVLCKPKHFKVHILYFVLRPRRKFRSVMYFYIYFKKLHLLATVSFRKLYTEIFILISPLRPPHSLVG